MKGGFNMLDHYKNTNSLKDLFLFKVTNGYDKNYLSMLADFACKGNVLQLSLNGHTLSIALNGVPVPTGDYLYLDKNNKLSVLPAAFVEANFEKTGAETPAPKSEITEATYHDADVEKAETKAVDEDEDEEAEAEAEEENDEDEDEELDLSDISSLEECAAKLANCLEDKGLEATLDIDEDDEDTASILLQGIAEPEVCTVANIVDTFDEKLDDFSIGMESSGKTNGNWDVIITINS